MRDFVNSILETLKHEFDVILPVALRSVPVDVLKIHSLIIEELDRLVVDPGNSNVQGIESLFVLDGKVRIVLHEEFAHRDVFAEGRPNDWGAPILAGLVNICFVFHQQLDNIPVAQISSPAHRICRTFVEFAFG